MKQSKLHANSFHVGFIKTVCVSRSTVNGYILGSEVQSWTISFCIRLCYPWWTNDGTHERARDVSTSNGRWNSRRGKRNTVRSTSHTRHMTTRACEILGWWFLREFFRCGPLGPTFSLEEAHSIRDYSSDASFYETLFSYPRFWGPFLEGPEVFSHQERRSTF